MQLALFGVYQDEIAMVDSDKGIRSATEHCDRLNT